MTARPVSSGEWTPRARRLSEALVAAGKLRSPEWIEAFTHTPRHVFTPDVLTPQPDGTWSRLGNDTAENQASWLDRVYSNTALLTATTESNAATSLRSSSSMPGLMARMLEALDIGDDDRVLEIGTGTGYNAALLAHRLGDRQVFSVDIEADLVELARNRLAAIGHHPTLAASDGAAGLAGHAPFDRIIATCAVPAIPWEWVEQIRLGGVILTDLKPARGAGSLVRLVRTEAGAQGRFDPVYAAFMDLRQPERPVGVSPTKDLTGATRHRTTTLDPNTPWASFVVWFLASFDLGLDVRIGYCRPDDTGRPTANSITIADGSWAEVTLAATGDTHEVVESGPRSVWHLIEDAHDFWTEQGEPGWDRFGLTVIEGGQAVWLDDPEGPHRWMLPETELGAGSRGARAPTA